MNEADTCRELVRPKLDQAGWDQGQHSYVEQTTFTDGRIVVTGESVRRLKKKRTDFLLRYTRDVTLAVVEAKSVSKPVGTGLQQAKEYAEILGLKFAFATNGREILEFDYLTGQERPLDAFPTPDELWQRFIADSSLDQVASQDYLSPSYHLSGKSPRYYQEIAINRALMAILSGQNRILLTMATGTGKTVVAFQLCWKLWSAKWNRDREHRRPKILFLADRSVLVDDPKDKTFAPFGDARWKIENGQVVKSREMYFALYQSIAQDQVRPGLYKEYPPDFFDLIVIDECHRGSARDDSNWREILDYFEPAHMLGMTATPLRDDNANTYQYFGPAIYTYSLKQGIQDGFLAPYRVHRIVSTYDAAGWRPDQGQLDRFGREIPDDEYHTRDFEKVIALRARTEAIAKHLTKHLKKTDRFAKTIVFCVDQEHADEMRRAISNENADLVMDYPDYDCRVTSVEGDIGRGHLSRFQELETLTPVILTTSQMLTTGVDAPTCKNVVLARVVESMTEFKQIIGRGTRVRDDYGKLYFSILDYTGSATRLFADRDFDGEPVIETQVQVDDQGDEVTGTEEVVEVSDQSDETEETETTDDSEGIHQETSDADGNPSPPRKFYVDTGAVTIDTELELELDPEGSQLSLVKIDDYAAEKVRTLYKTLADFRAKWTDPEQRIEIVALFEDRGISLDQLASAANQPDADPFDLLCHLAFNAPLRTRRDRADRFKKDKQDFFDQYGPEAKAILEELLTKYAEHGMAQFVLPDALEVPPISGHGNVLEIASFFGGYGKACRGHHEPTTKPLCGLSDRSGTFTVDAIDFFISDSVALPKERDSGDFAGYASKLLDDYWTQMQRVKATTLADVVITTRIELVYKVSELLRDCLRAYFQGFPHEAYQTIGNVMTELGPHFDVLCPSGDKSGSINPMFRFRTEGKEAYARKDLFHIPFESRHFVGPMRYSIPGLPCLYAGGSTYVCWRELREPDLNRVWVTRVNAKTDTNLKVLNFGHRPTFFARWIANRPDDFKDFNDNTAVLGSAVACWPLLALCSVRVRHDDGRFKPEYVIPQLVLQWITKSREFHGVRYFSTHYLEYHDNPGSYMNYVFPARSVGASGHCTELSSMFELTEPMPWNEAKGEDAPLATRPIYKFHGNVLADLEKDFGHVEDVLLTKPTLPI